MPRGAEQRVHCFAMVGGCMSTGGFRCAKLTEAVLWDWLLVERKQDLCRVLNDAEGRKEINVEMVVCKCGDWLAVTLDY